MVSWPRLDLVKREECEERVNERERRDEREARGVAARGPQNETRV